MIRVELRQRKRLNGKSVLYLDYYPAIPHPKTRKPQRQEYLKLFIWDNPKGSAQKEYNKEILTLATSILSNRINEVNKSKIYSHFEQIQLKQLERDDMDFIEYFKKLTRKKEESNSKTWNSVLKYLVEYFPNGLRFGDITENIIEDFRNYLLTAKSIRSQTDSVISQNTALAYFNKVKATLKQAFKDRILKEDINGRIETIKAKETHREYLTIEEINKLIDAPCEDAMLKRASLFSILTGLRFSDVAKLKGNEVRNDETGYHLMYSQQKTDTNQVHYISEQAYNLLGEFQKDKTQIFKGLKYSAYRNRHLSKWIGLAGITKKITFHNFRHTYATLQLQHGTDIYTVSKLLGHKSLKTTQIYAKVVDEFKRKASAVIKVNNLDNL